MTQSLPDTTREGSRGPSEGPQKADLASLDAFTLGYIRCALWASLDESREDGGDPLDKHYSAEDIAPETLAQMAQDCAAFQANHAEDLAWGSDAAGGHDFWLTRNGHGAGFWDGEWEEAIGQRLTDACKAFGAFDLYVGDDGRVHGS